MHPTVIIVRGKSLATFDLGRGGIGEPAAVNTRRRRTRPQPTRETGVYENVPTRVPVVNESSRANGRTEIPAVSGQRLSSPTVHRAEGERRRLDWLSVNRRVKCIGCTIQTCS
jgi:hypothetical protein